MGQTQSSYDGEAALLAGDFRSSFGRRLAGHDVCCFSPDRSVIASTPFIVAPDGKESLPIRSMPCKDGVKLQPFLDEKQVMNNAWGMPS